MTRWYGRCDGTGCEDAERTLWDDELPRTGIGDERLCPSCIMFRRVSIAMIRDHDVARDPRVVLSTDTWGSDTYGSVVANARRALTIAAARAENPAEAMMAAYLAAER